MKSSTNSKRNAPSKWKISGYCPAKETGEWEWRDIHESEEIRYASDWLLKIFFLKQGKETIQKIRIYFLKNSGGELT